MVALRPLKTIEYAGLHVEPRRLAESQVDAKGRSGGIRAARASCTSKLARHLDHRRPETRVSEQPLCRLVLRGCREHYSRYVTLAERCQSGVEQSAADAAIVMSWIDDYVMQNASRSAKRHVVVSLDRCVRVALHFIIALRNEYDDVRIVELRADERSVARLGARRSGDEALRIKIVMHPNE